MAAFSTLILTSTSLSLSRPLPRLASSATVARLGRPGIDGSYYIHTAEHVWNRHGGYITILDIAANATPRGYSQPKQHAWATIAP